MNRGILRCVRFAVITMLCAMTTSLRADVFNMPVGQTSLQFVSVANPGNAADTTGYGAVSYTFQIAKYDVTNAQYAQFLNAKDPNATSTLLLYRADMTGIAYAGSNPPGSKFVAVAGHE